MARKCTRLGGVERLEPKQMLAADLLAVMPPEQTPGGSDNNTASFSFGVEREMKESGEKGGTAAMHIGVGELQECTISKSMDMASTKLVQYAIHGNSPGKAVLDLGHVGDGGVGDEHPREDVAFYYNKIAFKYANTSDGLDSPINTRSLAATGEALAETTPICYLQYKLERCFVKSWSTSGDADDRPTEEVAFYWNR